MHWNPDDLSVAERYKLLIGAIVPRPIALISTVSPAGEPNLAPYSFFNGVGSNPMMLMFCPANAPDGSEKDTLRNAKPAAEGGQGEFVVNVASERYYRQVAAAAEPLAPGESEFELVGLATKPSSRVAPPRVADTPLAFECRTEQVIRTNPGQPAGGNLVLGSVVAIYAAEGVVSERFHVAPEALRAIGRMGGLGYVTTRDRFEVARGRVALEAADRFADGGAEG